MGLILVAKSLVIREPPCDACALTATPILSAGLSNAMATKVGMWRTPQSNSNRNWPIIANDSIYDGGKFDSNADGFAHARQLIEAAMVELGRDRTCDLFFTAETGLLASSQRCGCDTAHASRSFGAGLG